MMWHIRMISVFNKKPNLIEHYLKTYTIRLQHLYVNKILNTNQFILKGCVKNKCSFTDLLLSNVNINIVIILT